MLAGTPLRIPPAFRRLFVCGREPPNLPSWLDQPSDVREVATPRKSCSSDGTSEHEDSDVSSSSLDSVRMPGCHKDPAAARAHPRRRRRVPQHPDGQRETKQNGPAQASAPEMTSAGDEQAPASQGGSVSRPLTSSPVSCYRLRVGLEPAASGRILNRRRKAGRARIRFLAR